MSNRFTQFNPTKFVQTYEPFPIDSAMKLMQFKRQRDDKANALLGKAGAAGALEGGLATGDKAREITAARNAQIAELTSAYQSGKKSYQDIAQDLIGVQAEWAQDKGAQLVKSDFDIKNAILANMAKEGYGQNFAYMSQMEDGSFDIGDINQMIAEGKTITPDMYRLLTNPGSEEAWKSTLDQVKAHLDETYTASKNDKGKIEYSIGTTESNLDMATFRDRAGPFLNGFRGEQRDDGKHSLGNLDNASPKLRAFIEWKSRGKKDYTYEQLVKDFETEAQKRIHFKNKHKETGMEDGSSGGSPVVSDDSGDLFLVPTSETDENVAEAILVGNDLKQVNSIRKAVTHSGFGLDGTSEDSRNDYNFISMMNDDRATRQAQRQKTYDSFLAEGEKNNPDFMIGGVMQKRYTQNELRTAAQNSTEKYLKIQKAHLSAFNNAVIEASTTPGMKVPELDEDGRMKAEAYVREDGTFLQRIGLGEIEDLIHGDEYSDFIELYGKKVKEEFGEQKYNIYKYKILTDADMGEKKIPMSHQIISDVAQNKARSSKTDIWRTGTQLNAVPSDHGGRGKKEGQTITDLYTSDEKSTSNFKGAPFKTEEFYYDSDHNKWFARGFYHKQGDEARSAEVLSARYDIDITTTMREQLLSGNDMAKVALADQILDFTNSLPKGTTWAANIGLGEDIIDKYGDIKVGKTLNGTFNISGNMENPIEGGKISIREAVKIANDKEGLGYDVDNLSQAQVVDLLEKVHWVQMWGSSNTSGPAFDGATISASLDAVASSDIGNTLWQEVGIEGGVSKDVLGDYARGIMAIESSGGTVNKMGGFNNHYLGLYQLGQDAIISAAKTLGIPKPTNNELLKDSELQTKLFQAHTLNNHKSWMTNDDYYNLPYHEKMAVLAYTHSAGIGNAMNDFSFVRDINNNLYAGSFKDGRGTASKKYFLEVLNRLNKHVSK